MSEIKFAKGLNIKAIQTQYGEIIKIGVNLESFSKNPNNNGWVNFDIKKSKEGKYYAQLSIKN